MNRRTFIRSSLAVAAATALVPLESEAAPEVFNASWGTEFLELPLPEPDFPYRPIAPEFPVRASWVNKQVMAKAIPGSIVYGWTIEIDEPLEWPEGSEGITVASCTITTLPTFKGEAAVVIHGSHNRMVNCVVNGHRW